MSGPGEVGTQVVRTWLSKEEAGQPLTHGDVWSEDLQRFVPRGQQFAIDAAKREADPSYQLARYEERRSALLKFIAGKLREAEYDERGSPLKGKMHDFYILPGYDKKTITKGGNSKVMSYLGHRVSERHVTHAVFEQEFGSARVRVQLVDSFGQPVGAYEAACSTAEAGFQNDGTRRKYGAVIVKGEEKHPPDYRASENDVVARAGKRAVVGAEIIAASLEEIFDLESSTDRAGEGEEEGERKPPRAQPPKAKEEGGPFMLIGDNKGTPLRQISAKELTSARAWCEKKNPQRWAKFIGQIDEELERRRTEEAE